ncbi:cupin domain-containing protein [Altererythrobacter sp. MF3-039]|uniref:cupin domain-containing protein n=1 Tax=Altererythrobacter sp. MF3-039 TaxID=3252901 RepID=UPI00390CACEC
MSHKPVEPVRAPGVQLAVEGPILGVEDRYLVSGIITLAPDGLVPRHVHDGEEMLVVHSGSVELSWFADDGWSQVQTKTIGAGEGFRIPPHTVHWAKAGREGTLAVSTWVVLEGAPLRREVATPADVKG